MSVNSRFAKARDCPTNEALLQFLLTNAGAAADEETAEICGHLTACEFCELTLELLHFYPPSPDVTPPGPPAVPAALAHLFTAQRENK